MTREYGGESQCRTRQPAFVPTAWPRAARVAASAALVVAVIVCAAALVLLGCASAQSPATTASLPAETTAAQAGAATTATAAVTTTTARPTTTSAAASSTSVSTSSSTILPHGDSSQRLEFGGLTRTFVVHVPPAYNGSTPLPLVVSFHGHGGTGATQAKLTHMSDVADAKGFLVVYPDGVNRAWNDGRSGINGADENIDDAGFVRELIQHLEAEYRIDSSRVYATGFSNGGFMCYRVARDLPDLVAAVAPVSGLLSEELAGAFASTVPISVLMIAGTADPLIPFNGGEVAADVMAGRGVVFSALDTASFFVNLDGCATPGQTVALANAVLLDQCRATRTTYGGGRQDTEVQLYTVIGGGHTWPGGLQYSPVRVTGPTCRDFDASQVIWEFFARHKLGG